MIAVKKDQKCYQAEPYFFDCVSGDVSHNVPAEIAEHVDHCPYCQGEMTRLMQALNELDNNVQANGVQSQKNVADCLKLHFSYLGQKVSCHTAKSFMPLLAVPGIQINIPTPITVHLDHCSSCRQSFADLNQLELTDDQLVLLAQRMTTDMRFKTDIEDLSQDIAALESHEGSEESKKIYRVLSSMARREDSGVVTVYEMHKSAAKPASEESDVLYADWPVSVQVLEGDEKNSSPQWVKKTASEKTSSWFRRAIKPVAAAALILIALSFFLNTSSVQATGLQTIYDALAKITHLHIVQYAPPRKDPLQEIWVSKPQKLTLIKSRGQWNLWDLSARIRKTRTIDNASIATATINKNDLPAAEQHLKNLLGLMPFPDVRDVPEDAGWHQISDVNTATTMIPGTEVFELTWTTITSIGRVVPQIWRCYLDPQNHLPFRIERYSKAQGEDEFVLKRITEIHYVEQSDIQKALQAASLQ